MTDKVCDRCGVVNPYGSHWHCGGCDSTETTSYMGHYTRLAGFHNGNMVLLPEHMMSCKPGYAEACRIAMDKAIRGTSDR